MPAKQLDKLADYSRYITTRDDKTGAAIYSTTHPVHVPELESPSGVIFTLDYLTNTLPDVMAGDADLAPFNEAQKQETGILPAIHTTANGVVLRHVFLPPRLSTPMHMSSTLDFAIVLQGEADMLLDGGEARRLKPHDTVVQRGTMHAFVNNSKTEWFRMVAVVMPAEVPERPAQADQTTA
jgi:quercetin dioxygenase-like cupin family protein